MPLNVILVLVFVLWFLAIVLVWVLIQNSSAKKPSYTQQRLSRLAKAINPKTSEKNQSALAGLLNQSEKPYYIVLAEKIAFTHHIDKLLKQSGLPGSAAVYALRYVYAPILGGLVFYAVTHNIIILVIPFLYAALGYIQLLMKKLKRFKKFNLQLPDTLGMMSSSLRAGHSLPISLSFISKEMSEPIGPTFANVVNDISLGIPLKTAFDNMLLGLQDLAELRLMVSAIIIQRDSGGNLAEILDTLSHTIRERFRVQGQIQALTGQSRLTGYIMGLAPLAMLIGLSLFFPSYMTPLLDTVIGKQLLALALVMQIIGFFVIKKIVDIRI